ncbi:MAG: nitronate monooxygenase [Chloroflexota bacterium]|nr:nitronate monooxygenase [Chloroflexota bacterium]
MGWIADANLAAAVSNAGGLGLISPTAGAREGSSLNDNLRQQIRKARQLTNKPLGVNVGLETEDPKGQLETALAEGIRIIVTAAGPPNLYTKRLKEAGAKVMHTVFSIRHAQRAEQEGVDAVIACGYEAGGLLARDELTTMTLVPQVVGAVKVPVIAAGGMADARGFVAALALGAQGIQMGTRFLATQECIAHPKFKEAILKAIDTDTTVTGRKSGPARVLKYKLAQQVLEMEARGASAQELQSFLGLGRLQKAALEGDLDDGSAMCGQIAGMIDEVLPAGEVVRRIVGEAEAVLAQVHQKTGS